MTTPELDLDAIRAQAQRSLDLFPDHDPYRVTGISAGYALDLLDEIQRLRAQVDEARTTASDTFGRTDSDIVEAMLAILERV